MSFLTGDAMLFFDGRPAELDLYCQFAPWLAEHFPEAVLDVQKTQLTFRSPRFFCAISIRRMVRRPKPYLVLTFGLFRPLDHPRVALSAHPTPKRWTHHVLLAGPEDWDETVLDWLNEAWDLSAK